MPPDTDRSAVHQLAVHQPEQEQGDWSLARYLTGLGLPVSAAGGVQVTFVKSGALLHLDRRCPELSTPSERVQVDAGPLRLNGLCGHCASVTLLIETLPAPLRLDVSFALWVGAASRALKAAVGPGELRSLADRFGRDLARSGHSIATIGLRRELKSQLDSARERAGAFDWEPLHVWAARVEWANRDVPIHHHSLVSSRVDVELFGYWRRFVELSVESSAFPHFLVGADERELAESWERAAWAAQDSRPAVAVFGQDPVGSTPHDMAGPAGRLVLSRWVGYDPVALALPATTARVLVEVATRRGRAASWAVCPSRLAVELASSMLDAKVDPALVAGLVEVSLAEPGIAGIDR